MHFFLFFGEDVASEQALLVSYFVPVEKEFTIPYIFFGGGGGTSTLHRVVNMHVS